MSYLFHGSNRVDLDERVRRLRHDIDPSDLNSTILDLSTLSASDISAAVDALPLFGGQRIVIIYAGKSSLTPVQSTEPTSRRLGWRDIEEVLIHAPVSTVIIVPIHEMLKSNSRLLKFASAQGWNIERFATPRGIELIHWVIDYGRRYSGRIEPPAAQRLLELLFPTTWMRESRYETQPIDMQRLATEIEKLTIAAGVGVVTRSLVESLVVDRSGYTAFKLTDAVYSGNTESTLKELDDILASGESPERVLALIARAATVLDAARLVERFGTREVAAESEISSGQLEVTAQRKSGLRNVEALERAAEATRHAEWLVKSGRSPRTETVIVPLAAEIAESYRRT